MASGTRRFYGRHAPRDNVFFRTKKTKSGEYLQLVRVEGGGRFPYTPRRQVVLHSFGNILYVDWERLKGTLDRIAEKMGVTT